MAKMQAENKKNNIKTLSFGCRLNALESEKIKNMLESHIDTAIIVNTCAFIHDAKQESINKIIEVGKRVTMQTNAYSKNVTGYFAKEIRYLLEHGYKIIQGGWGMGPK